MRGEGEGGWGGGGMKQAAGCWAVEAEEGI